MTPRSARQPFGAWLAEARQRNGSALCVGIDPDPAALPGHLQGLDGMRSFVQAIVDATADLVCAFKPNLAFFERFGSDGWRLLESLVAAVPPGIPVIADGKRGDIGNTSSAYAEALYDRLGAAACTVNPYLGADALEPLLDHPRGFAFVLCRNSNPGAGALQDLIVDAEPLYARVIRLFQPWLASERAGLVIGAQEAAAFAWAARLAPDALLLVPGVGAQGGTIEHLAAALVPAQRARVLVSASRTVIHAGRDADFAGEARRAALALRDRLRRSLDTLPEEH
ncbi:MAG TPA: orotidine-5'-phosphate decarboxylase [Chloroflexota bacterium]|nr:orotidine-5'-phosphate decarboxylase [Chloroflexota bacterium]